MTTIKQLSEMPVGSRTGGFALSVKTYKKTWQVGDVWYQQVILMDKTGEMPADVNLGKVAIPNTQKTLRGHGNTLNIIVCEVQEAEYLAKGRKKLYVDQFSRPTMTVAEYEDSLDEDEQKWDAVVKGKIRMHLVCSFIRAGDVINDLAKQEVNRLVEYIQTGEIK